MPPFRARISPGARHGRSFPAAFGSTGSATRNASIEDALVGIDARRGINNGQPSLHAQALDALGVREGETIVQVGAGAGYYTAILATLVGSRAG